MTTATILIAIAVAIVGYGAFELVKLLMRRRSAAREAVFVHLRRDTRDFVRVFWNEHAPERRVLTQAVSEARAVLTVAGEAVATRAASFPGGPPSLPVIIRVAIVCCIWIVVASAQFALDLPIARSVLAGDSWLALLGTLVLVSVPIIASILLALLWDRRAGENALPGAQFRAGMFFTSLVLAGAIATMVVFAAVRSEVEYAGPIREASQQVVEFGEDGDTTAVEFAQIKLDQLREQQRQSTTFNQALVVLSALAEATTGLALPMGAQLLLLAGAKRREDAAKKGLVARENRRDNAGEARLQELSRLFVAAGMPQSEIEQAVAEITGGTPPTALPAATPPAPVGPAAPAASAGTAPAPVQPPPAPQQPPTMAGPREEVIDSFDPLAFDQI